MLAQKRVRSYTVDKNKRVYRRSADGEDCGGESIYTSSFTMNLPIVLTDEYRNRHRLSLIDYQHIFHAMEVQDLWKLALFYCRDITTSAVQTSPFATSDMVTFGGNTDIVKKLLAYISKTLRLAAEPRLSSLHDGHKPPLPVHFVDTKTWNSLEPPSTTYAHVYKWADIEVVPMRYYNGYVLMVHVLPRGIHEARYGKPQNLLERRPEFLIGRVVYTATHESFLVQTAEGHAALNKLDAGVVAEQFSHSAFQGSSVPLSAKTKQVAAAEEDNNDDSSLF